MSKKTAGQIGPRIVRAWFDTVNNPLLDALQIEIDFLSRENWTWRSRPAGLELIRRCRAHLDSAGQTNLEQLSELYGEVGSVIDEHDRGVEGLAAACKEFHTALMSLPAFRELYQRIASTPEAKEALRVYDEEAAMNLLAENVVNGVSDLPAYYGTAPLWNRYREELLRLRGHPGPAAKRQIVLSKGADLSRAVDHLHKRLRDLRYQLSLAHDVPYVSPASPPSPTGSI